MALRRAASLALPCRHAARAPRRGCGLHVQAGAAYSTAKAEATLDVNGRSYALSTDTRVAAILLDGSAQEYWDCAVDAGVAPNAKRLFFGEGAPGCAALVDSVVPTFTNPNNVAVISGAPPAVTGVTGNFFINADGEEVMMNDPALLRCDTVLAAASRAGAQVIAVTAKHKLLGLLSHGLVDGAAYLSAEKAASEETAQVLQASGLATSVADLMGPANASPAAAGAVPEWAHDGAPPHIYDPMCSVYALDAGRRLIQRELAIQASIGVARPVVAYLSTSDYVQHKHRPEEDGALQFYAAVDEVIGGLDALGMTVALTADHGMNDKHVGGDAQVVFLESALEAAGISGCRVILPITDPYVVHHGALGGYATVYLGHPDQATVVSEVLRGVDGGKHVEEVFTREQAVATFGLAADRIGDLVVLATHGSVLGRRPEYHDLSQVHNLRSHGSRHEQIVPMLLSRPPVDAARLDTSTMDAATRASLVPGACPQRNWDMFDLLLNA